MEIKFEQYGLLYVAEIEVASNCNLHIERESRGAFTIAQRGTKQGKYAYITDENYDDSTIIDVDMLGNIYPKYIKVTSTSKPTYAEVNFAEEGGGNSGDGGSVEYYKVDENFLSTINDQSGMLFIAFPCFLNKDSEVASFVKFYFASSDTTPMEILTSSQGIALFPDAEMMSEGGIFTFNNLAELLGLDISKWQKITKEEFYNLGA